MFWPLLKLWHFPHKIHCARINTLAYLTYNQLKIHVITIDTMIQLEVVT